MPTISQWNWKKIEKKKIVKQIWSKTKIFKNEAKEKKLPIETEMHGQGGEPVIC